MVETMVRLARGLPVAQFAEDDRTVKRWLYPSIRDIMEANAWLQDHYTGKPTTAEPPQHDDKPGLTIIFTKPEDWDPMAHGAGNPHRVMARELKPDEPQKKGSHEVVDL